MLFPVLCCLLFPAFGWKFLSSLLRWGSTRDGSAAVGALEWATATLVSAAAALYGLASIFYSTYFMRDRVCDFAGNYDLLPVSGSYLPLSTKCPRGDAIVEIVPGWVNPALLGMVLASVSLATAAAVGHCHRARRRRAR